MPDDQPTLTGYWPILLSLIIAGVLGSTDLISNLAMYGRIHADAQGYYGYLVAAFIENTFDWEQVTASYADTYFGGKVEDFTSHVNHRVNKYFVGVALLSLPFFLLSCITAWLLGFPVDGYSIPFHAGAMLGALFYIGIGLGFLVRFLIRNGIGHRIAMFVAITCFAASGLFHYAVSEPLMSHAYSFSLFCLFLFSVGSAFEKPSTRNIIAATIIFSLIVLVRPSNALVILSVPFITGGFRPLLTAIRKIKNPWRSISVVLVILGGILSIQLLMYWFQVGQLFVWGYDGEGFNFTHPNMLKVLFSYRKGFFIYTPWAFLGAIGLLFYLLKNKAAGFWLWLCLGFSVYVISSWWSWYYGSSFGMRPLIEYLPFFAFGLAFLLQNSRKWLRITLVVLSLAFIPINLIQSYQYNRFILHWDRMNSERYWQVFLQTDKKYEGLFWNEGKATQPENETTQPHIEKEH
ncbi:MAG: hypothetical protein JKX84_04060 [Flavobacteriales bacterium]|nr:hypothetical protein [Flavobacteriales bacterium]